METNLKKLTVPHRVLSLTASSKEEELLFAILKEDNINTLKLQYYDKEILLLLPNACIRKWQNELEKKAKKEVKEK